ncbi:hypothetical protein CD29_17065 [Ureibacillus manganicus DSM 26584]|uniref:BioF2-like acetyltransferase domain-containing protein n=2 Tax=Ureibacillus TaxID=160795 RepID=A0A0A3IMY2_9BACL|nr:hypothetical protein CD29_17065 [Ureibacillus manganicus DSM 26584]
MVKEMTKNNKDKYRQFSELENTIPLFSKGWWMDAVCGEDWDVILVEENDKIIAALPYYFEDHEGFKEIRKAPLTQNNGIWISYPPNQKYENRLSLEHRLMSAVIDEIEKLNINKYQQYYHYSITNHLPFFWRGYTQSTRYTYVIADTTNLDELYKNFSSSIRNKIRKAEKSVSVVEDLSIEQFYQLNKMTFERQQLTIPYSLELVSRIDEECDKRNARKIYYAIDKQKQIHSAAYFVWDEKSVYYLMAASDPAFRTSQSLSLLIYEGIKLASRLGKKFDFEGSMKKNIEEHFRQFGAKQFPYHHIQKTF